MPGWFYIEREQDGTKGWVPSNYLREVESNHIRAKHFKQRYLFLKALTADADSSLEPQMLPKF